LGTSGTVADKNGKEWLLDRKNHFMKESEEELDTDENLSGTIATA